MQHRQLDDSAREGMGEAIDIAMCAGKMDQRLMLKY